MIYIIMGGPATGKGTRSNILSNSFDIPHISTGALLREVAKKDTNIRNLISKGELIDDETITKLIKEKIMSKVCEKGFILDGYPRTFSQVLLLNETLEELGMKIDKVIELIVCDKLAFSRILERKACVECGKTYGVDFKPKRENICDVCDGRLEGRTDDTRDTLKRRIDMYRENSKEILEYYKKQGLLKTIDASTHPEYIVKVVSDN